MKNIYTPKIANIRYPRPRLAASVCKTVGAGAVAGLYFACIALATVVFYGMMV